MVFDKNITPPTLYDDYECDETFDPPIKSPYSESDEHFWHDAKERARDAQNEMDR